MVSGCCCCWCRCYVLFYLGFVDIKRRTLKNKTSLVFSALALACNIKLRTGDFSIDIIIYSWYFFCRYIRTKGVYMCSIANCVLFSSNNHFDFILWQQKYRVLNCSGSELWICKFGQVSTIIALPHHIYSPCTVHSV